MKYYTSRDLLKMNLSELEKLELDELIEAICTLEVTIYTLESNNMSYSKEAQKQREIKSLIRNYKRKTMSY